MEYMGTEKADQLISGQEDLALKLKSVKTTLTGEFKLQNFEIYTLYTCLEVTCNCDNYFVYRCFYFFFLCTSVMPKK